MGHVSHYKPGEHLFVCDQCGFVFHSNQKRKMWNGLVVDPGCFEVRHPQDYVRGKKDDQSVTDPRPEQGNRFLAVDEVDSTDFEETATPAAIPATTFLEPGDVTVDDL